MCLLQLFYMEKVSFVGGRGGLDANILLQWQWFYFKLDATLDSQNRTHTDILRHTHTQSLRQNECLSINGSWQNRLSQAWKSTWIPTRLELDALMWRCLRPLVHVPRHPFTQRTAEPSLFLSGSNIRVLENRTNLRSFQLWRGHGSEIMILK